MSGKGSAPRPFSVKDDVFTEAYCRVFGCKPKDGKCRNCWAKLESSPNKVEADNGNREPDE